MRRIGIHFLGRIPFFHHVGLWADPILRKVLGWYKTGWSLKQWKSSPSRAPLSHSLELHEELLHKYVHPIRSHRRW
jgi:hypothetical protein